MIEVTFKFNSHTEAKLAMDAVESTLVTPNATAPAAPAAPALVAAPSVPSLPAAPAPVPAVAPAPVPPPTAQPAAPAQCTPEQLQTEMQTKTAALADGGAACRAIITECGVDGIAAMTDQQRDWCLAKVQAL